MSRARGRRTRRKPVEARRRPKKGHVEKKPRSKVEGKPRSRKIRVPKVKIPHPHPAELRLLELAQELAELARNAENGQALSAPVLKLAAAYGPSAPLPQEVFRAWARSRNDKTAALALSWAREQVRLGLQEVVERTKGARSRVDIDAQTLAWILLAGCEAIAQEPPSAGADRVRAMLELIGHATAAD